MTKRYNYADYLTWLDDIRRELIDGFINLMSAPSDAHAVVSNNISLLLGVYLLKNKCNCKVFHAPYDVRLPKNGETAHDKIYTVVQPDVCVICDQSKRDEAGCCGAPDLIVEVLSPSTRKKDMHKKYSLYEQAGVREYWIADPKVKTIIAYILQQDGEYDNGSVYMTGEKIPVHIFAGYQIDINDIFNG